MLFNSLTFLIFAAIFFVVWHQLSRQSQRLFWVTAMSFVFYGWADWRFVFLLLANGLIDFYAALAIERFPRYRRLWLLASLSGNVGCLAAFKYLGFVTRSLNEVFQAIGLGQFPIVQLALPIGISFYTFQSMSYTIDVYRGQLRATPSVVHFFAFLTMFPQLVAGPIVRAADLLPQLTQLQRTTEALRWAGLTFIARGYFMKVVVADNLAPIINDAFGASAPTASLPYWWLIITMFAMQIYCDFCGYSLIAQGLGKWMGVEFMDNFRHPYWSLSLREFWTRWHISLSTWFRDYVYIPLGGSRGSAWFSYRNLWITVLISGLWHGAAWTFVIWGACHALFLSLERWLQWPQRLSRWAWGRTLSWALLIVQVWIAWVFFRAESFGQALSVVTIMVDPSAFNLGPALDVVRANDRAMFGLAAGILMELGAFVGARRVAFARPRLAWLRPLTPVAVSLTLVACVFLRGPGSEFIYFQF
jgi:D-alanyl-lipoteichoic acid acyltransferase DltB (MBOAT superfamily)